MVLKYYRVGRGYYHCEMLKNSSPWNGAWHTNETCEILRQPLLHPPKNCHYQVASPSSQSFPFSLDRRGPKALILTPESGRRRRPRRPRLMVRDRVVCSRDGGKWGSKKCRQTGEEKFQQRCLGSKFWNCTYTTSSNITAERRMKKLLNRFDFIVYYSELGSLKQVPFIPAQS